MEESEEKLAGLQMQMMDLALSSDYVKLGEIQKQIEEEEHLQETLLERMVETETELADLQEQ